MIAVKQAAFSKAGFRRHQTTCRPDEFWTAVTPFFGLTHPTSHPHCETLVSRLIWNHLLWLGSCQLAHDKALTVNFVPLCLPFIQFNCSSCVEQFANNSAVFWVTGHFSTPPENWTVRAFLQLTPCLSNDFTAVWLTFTFPQLFVVVATLKSIDYNVAMTFILNNSNNNSY